MAASVQKFPLSLFSVQLLPVGVLEMTSAERERRVSPSLLRVSVCCHGSSCHFLPEWVFLCSFIFVCTLKRSHSVLCLHCHIWGGFYQQRAQGFPRCRKNLHEHIHKHIFVCATCACAHSPTHTHTHERVPVPRLFKAFQTSPICTQLSPLTVRWNVNGYAITGGFQGSVQQMIK